MQGRAMPLQQVLGNGSTQLVIPVYQRNYSWRIENCNQLLADIIKFKDSQRNSHRNKLTGLRYIFDELELANEDLVLMIEPKQKVKDSEV